MNNNYENKILDAIQTLVDSAVSNAGYDKTIKGIISKCVNQNTGKYVVRYQDSSFYAYSNDLDSIYSGGTPVYVLVPGNDMSQTKTILGSVDKLGTEYITLSESSAAYQEVGTSVITPNGTIPGISSYKAGGDSLVIYDRTSVNNLVNVDTEGAELYFQQSNHMEIGGTFTTILNEEQKRKGNYGLVFDMDFKNGEEIVNKQYVIDINSMTGNPYSYNLGSEQSAIFEIDGVNFYRLNSITLECKNFPKSATPYTSDIFVKDIILKALTPLTRDEIANNSLTFITKQGIYFNENDSASATRLIETEVKINKKVVPNTGGLLRFYWFKEDSTVSITSPDYLPFGGPGWKCLNEYNVIDETNNIRDYITDADTLTVVKSENPAKENEYKCVVIYNNEIQVERNIIIYNQASEYTITIESDQGNYFKYNEGNPTLTCSVNPAGTYTYIWTETDSSNRTEVLTETSNIYSVQLGSIAGFSKFTCSVYSNENFLGKSDIVITNSWDPEDNSYALVMENGDQIFKYNEKGIAPTNKSLEKPIVLKPLQFIVYDELGHQVDDNKIVATDVSWYVPKENTMIKISDAGIEPVEDGDYLVYTGLKTINFTIASVYNIKQSNNTIKLVVKYNDRVLNTVSELEFIKEGEIGSNGTDFVCRIVPNVAANAQIPNYPIYTYNTTTSTGAMNYTLAANNKWFKVQLYKDGVQIYEGVTSGTSEENKAVTVDWSMLTNKYSSTVSDATSFSVNSSTGEFSYTNLSDTNLDRAANITKVTVTYDGATYYATMPIILVRVANANYKLDLENNTGFRYVMYTTDGLNPVYDSSNPFALIAYNGTTDITNVNNITFTYSTLGQTYNGTEWVNENNFIVKTHGASNPLAKNEADYRPIEKFDGLSTNNAIKCVVKENSSEIARAYLPIHFYLNRFGNAALNGWDGNHIEINNNGGFILAPQVGAGKKENDNSYTGIFMGNVREAGSSIDEVGLYGYYKGTRTIALDTKDGSARFGKQGAGQIVIDPAAADYDGKGTARLYSNDYSITYTAPSAMVPAQTKYTAGFSYWRKVSSTEYRLLREGVDYTIGNTIANTDYVWNGGAGLEIDLNDPHIRFGSGKFRVDSDGQVYATGFVTVNNLEAGDYNIPSASIDVGGGDNLNDYMSTTNNTLANLQSQIDGAIQFWNGQDVPLPSSQYSDWSYANYPAEDWTTEDERINHQADIYTVIEDVQGEWKQGKSYRFDKVEISPGTERWIWIELTDQEMSAVQALAASKAKVFIKDIQHPNPTPPYSIGDMWFADGDMYTCINAKDNTGSYAASDWELATDYTDDTAVDTLKQNVISSSEVQYALGDDAVTAPTTGWSASTPTWTVGKYVWQRTVVTYADSTTTSPHTSTSDPVCIQGAKGEDGGSGYTVVLSNESHTFPATDTHALAGSTTIDVVAYKGASAITPTIGTITGQVTGLTTSVSNSTITITVTTSLVTTNGELTIPITVDGHSITKKFSWSLAKAGADGTSPTAYSLITSNAVVAKKENNTYVPESVTFYATSQTGNGAISTYTSGSYRITKDGTAGSWTNLSASNSYSFTTNTPTSGVLIEIAKENASSGTHTVVDKQTISVVYDGTSGKSIVVDTTTLSYQNSTSGTTIPTGTWTSSPSPEEGKYLWTKTVTTYKLSGTSTSAGSTTSYSVAYTGTDGGQGRSLVAQIPLHYLKSNDTAPAAPTSHVTSTSTDPDVWTTAMPEYIDGYTYFACSENEFSIAPLYEWTNVVKDNGLNEALIVANQAKESVNNILDDIDNPTNEKTGKYIDIDDALSVPMIDFKMYGDTQQNTTTGKNKLPSISDFNTTINLVTFIGNKGIYSMSGTTDLNNSASFPKTSTINTYTIQSGDYLHLGNDKTNASITFSLYFDDNTNQYWATNAINRIVSLDNFVGKTMNAISIYVAKNTNTNGMILKPMICNSSTTTDFEPYTNGASPNPSYPEPVNVVTGDNTIEICGKNLYNKDTEKDKYYYSATGVKTFSSGNYFTTQRIERISDSYAVSMKAHHQGGGIVPYVRFVEYKKDGTFIQRQTTIGSATITLHNDTSYFLLNVDAGPNAYYEELQIEMGETASTYQEYQAPQTQLISLGVENEYKASKTIQGTFNANSSLINTRITWFGKQVSSGETMTITCNNDNLRFSTGRTSMNECNASNVLSQDSGWKTSTYTITFNGSGYAFMGVSKTDNTAISTSELTDTDFTITYNGNRYSSTPIELCKIGDYQDYLYKDNGSWYIHKEIGKYTFTGNESWYISGSALKLANLSSFYPISNVGYSDFNTLGLYCNYGSSIAAGNIYNGSTTNKVGLSSSLQSWGGTTDAIYVSKGDYTVDSFKALLVNNPLICYYILSTPTNTIITDTTLISQLDKLMTQPLFENINHITDETFNASPDLYIKYYRNTTINQNFASKDDLNSVKGTADKAYEQVQSTNVLYTTTNTINEPGTSAVWLDTLPSVSDKYIWQKIVYTFLDTSKNYESSPACIYTPSKVTNELQYCLCSQNNYDETKITDAWQSESFPWDDSYYESTGVGNITILRYQFVRNKYTDTNKETDNVTYSDPVLDQAWYMFGYKLAAESLERQALSNNINNNIVTINNQDGITVSGEDSSYGIRLTSLGMQFLLENQTTHVREWTTVWDIYGNLDASAITVTDLRADNILSGTLTLNTAENNGSFVLVNGNGNTNINGNGVTVNSLGANTYVQLKNNTGGITAVANNTEYFGAKPDTKTTTMDNAVVKNDFSFNTSVKVVHVTNGIAFIGI